MSWLRKHPGWVAGAVLVIAVLWGLHQMRAAAQARGEAREADRRAESAVERATRAREAAAEVSAMLRDSARALAAERAENETLGEELREREREAEEDVTAAGDSVDATVDVLRGLVREAVVPVVDTLAMQLRAERQSRNRVASLLREQNRNLQAIIVQADSQTALCRRGREACRQRAESAEAALAEMRVARDRWREAADPGFFAEMWDALPQVGLGAAVAVGAVVILR